MPSSTSESAINAMLMNAASSQADVAATMKVRRMLVSRDRNPALYNATGVYLPPPFDQSGVAIRAMLGEASKAVNIAASRITSNPPDIQVIPLTTKNDVNVTVAKRAGEQERLDMEMWYENGGADCQWQAAWAKCVGAAAFWLSLPREVDFGLPTRTYFDESDDELDAMRRGGKVTSLPKTTEQGSIWPETYDSWIARRQEHMKKNAIGAISGRSMFSLSVYPRDMVLKERDREAKDLKWAAIVEEIPSYDCAPGSDFAYKLGKSKGMSDDVAMQYGIFYDPKTKRITGGIPLGGPLNSSTGSFDAFTLIRWFDRMDQVILAAPRGSVNGATEIWRGPHGCQVQGVPSCPVVEDAFFRTDVNVTGKEYATALDPAFAYFPSINQLMTLMSNVAAYNGVPRLVGELQAGSTLRGDSGEPSAVDSAPVPGLNPNEIAFYPGKVTQLTIQAETLIEALKIYFERLEMVMPSMGAEASSADAAGWAIMQRIQEGQQPYVEPVRNFCQAVTGIIQRWHGWMRELDVPIYFWAAPGHRSSVSELRGLVEFDPKDITDSIKVTQDVFTQSEQTVRKQVAQQQWQATLITDEDYYNQIGEPDARAAVIRRWVQIIINYVMTGALPPVPPGTEPSPDAMVKIVADGVRGAVHYQMIQQSDNYAIAAAEQMVGQANQEMMAQQTGMQPQMPGQPQQPIPQGGGSVAGATGLRMPGEGMSTNLQTQLGPMTQTPSQRVG